MAPSGSPGTCWLKILKEILQKSLRRLQYADAADQQISHIVMNHIAAGNRYQVKTYLATT